MHVSPGQIICLIPIPTKFDVLFFDPRVGPPSNSSSSLLPLTPLAHLLDRDALDEDRALFRIMLHINPFSGWVELVWVCNLVLLISKNPEKTPEYVRTIPSPAYIQEVYSGRVIIRLVLVGNPSSSLSFIPLGHCRTVVAGFCQTHGTICGLGTLPDQVMEIAVTKERAIDYYSETISITRTTLRILQ